MLKHRCGIMLVVFSCFDLDSISANLKKIFKKGLKNREDSSPMKPWRVAHSLLIWYKRQAQNAFKSLITEEQGSINKGEG